MLLGDYCARRFDRMLLRVTIVNQSSPLLSRYTCRGCTSVHLWTSVSELP
jgi:hypothetical protein